MTDKQFERIGTWEIEDLKGGYIYNLRTIYDIGVVCNRLNQLSDENEQLKTQIGIFETFLEVIDLDINWEDFCRLDECVFENPNFSCKDCIYLRGDVE